MAVNAIGAKRDEVMHVECFAVIVWCDAAILAYAVTLPGGSLGSLPGWAVVGEMSAAPRGTVLAAPLTAGKNTSARL